MLTNSRLLSTTQSTLEGRRGRSLRTRVPTSLLFGQEHFKHVKRPTLGRSQHKNALMSF
ncbi:hypothetical protein [Fischerella sp. PCC 9605]|uniref:hypothetical protein n=1 Tax=Fischerella sp. PCC 9605 TaxID=1173024 RepID=UPI0012DBCC8D|nr:hypothetical protein [Fischerella sp. PCC 9605]